VKPNDVNLMIATDSMWNYLNLDDLDEILSKADEDGVGIEER
jgi:hypothetical protein